MIAEHLASTTCPHPDTKLETHFFNVGTLGQELEKLPGPNVELGLLDFIEHLLVVDQ